MESELKGNAPYSRAIFVGEITPLYHEPFYDSVKWGAFEVERQCGDFTDACLSSAQLPEVFCRLATFATVSSVRQAGACAGVGARQSQCRCNACTLGAMSLYSSNTTLPRSTVPVGPPWVIATSKNTRGFASLRRACLTLGILGIAPACLMARSSARSICDGKGKARSIQQPFRILLGMLHLHRCKTPCLAGVMNPLAQILKATKRVCHQVPWPIVALTAAWMLRGGLRSVGSKTVEASQEQYHMQIVRDTENADGTPFDNSIEEQAVGDRFNVIVKKSRRPLSSSSD